MPYLVQYQVYLTKIKESIKFIVMFSKVLTEEKNEQKDKRCHHYQLERVQQFFWRNENQFHHEGYQWGSQTNQRQYSHFQTDRRVLLELLGQEDLIPGQIKSRAAMGGHDWVSHWIHRLW